MIYTHKNAMGAEVVDIEGRERIKQVAHVDTDSGEVRCYRSPLRLCVDGEADAFTVRFQSIHPIRGTSPIPVAFHCYGRLS